MYFIFVLSYGKQSLDGVVYLYDPFSFLRAVTAWECTSAGGGFYLLWVGSVGCPFAAGDDRRLSGIGAIFLVER